MIKHWITPVGLAAAILSAIAIALPVMQWASIPSDTTSKAIYALAALALGLCKLSFFPRSASLIKQKRPLAAAALIVFSCLLLYISIESSAQLLSKHTTAHNTQSTANALAIAEINTEINSLQALIKTDIASEYHKIRARVTAHQARIDALKTQRKTLQTTHTTTTRFFTSSITRLINAEYLIALCIHLGGILAILCLTAWQPIKQQRSAIRTTPSSPATKRKPTRKKQARKKAPAKTFTPVVVKTETQEATTRHD